MFSDLLFRIRSFFQRSTVESELDDELRFHLDQHVAKLVERGTPPAEAVRQARLEFGATDVIKEEVHDARGVRLLDSSVQDLRFAIRILAKNWKLAGIAVFSLAVAMMLGTFGIGVANGVLFRPPVASHPENLVSITSSSPNAPVETLSYPDYVYFRDHAQTVESLAAFPYQITKARLVLGNRDDAGMMEIVSDNYFQTMGIVPALGELFHPGVDASRAPVAVLSYSRWKRWGSDPQIAGKTLLINKHAVTIVGVAPEKFTGSVFGFSADVMISLGTNAVFSDPHFFTDGQNRWLTLVGRIKPGENRQRVAVEMRSLSAQLAAAQPETNKDHVAVVGPLRTLPVDSRSTAVLLAGVLVAIVLLVLLIACANVANLLLGLSTGRKQEILVRTALGATRGRLIRQLLTESLILCGAGGVLGFAIASAILGRFAHFQTAVPIIGSFDIALDVRADGWVPLLSAAMILVASLATGLAPALHASMSNLAGALSGEAVVGGRRKGILRGALVVVQVAVCTLVMVGVGLCFRSVRNLQSVDTGFDVQHLAGVMSDLGEDGFTEVQRPAIFSQIRAAAAGVPGVSSVSLAIDFPFMDDNWYGDDVELASGGTASAKVHIPRTIVDENYFATMGIALLDGRAFAPSDTKAAPAVAIVNRSMAETYWPGQPAVGKRFTVGDEKKPVTIVGVAANSKYNTLDEETHPVIYYALAQRNEPLVIAIIRTEGNPRPALASFVPKLASFGVKSDMSPFIGTEPLQFALLIPTITLWVILGLGALALLLAVFGLYGAIFYSVNERRKEIGIRVALGAGSRDVLALFFRQCAVVSGIGVAVGVALGIAATVLFRSQFFGIAAVELRVLIPVAAAMMAVALFIAYIAARPWIDVSPMDVVRHS
jgi:predicted permease